MAMGKRRASLRSFTNYGDKVSHKFKPKRKIYFLFFGSIFFFKACNIMLVVSFCSHSYTRNNTVNYCFVTMGCNSPCDCDVSDLVCLFFQFQADSDAHSTTSSVSPAQSPSYSNQSDDGSDIESKQRRSTPSIYSFLDRSYWKR